MDNLNKMKKILLKCITQAKKEGHGKAGNLVGEMSQTMMGCLKQRLFR
jgi:hypothetical protein